MRKSIKKQVWIRVAAAIGSVLLFAIMTFVSLSNIKATENDSQQAAALLDRAQKAEVAHYKWSSNLSNALYAGKEFTGSLDPTTCVLGQWLYGEAGTTDERVLSLREQIEPLHKELHQSASQALEILSYDAVQSQNFYQNTIQTNLGTLVGLLDEVVTCSTELSSESAAELAKIISNAGFRNLLFAGAGLPVQFSNVCFQKCGQTDFAYYRAEQTLVARSLGFAAGA